MARPVVVETASLNVPHHYPRLRWRSCRPPSRSLSSGDGPASRHRRSECASRVSYPMGRRPIIMLLHCVLLVRLRLCLSNRLSSLKAGTIYIYFVCLPFPFQRLARIIYDGGIGNEEIEYPPMRRFKVGVNMGAKMMSFHLDRLQRLESIT